jgi:hypothetical protein
MVYVNNAMGLATLNSLVANPEFHYVNLHTTTHPNGVIRAQLTPLTSSVPSISAVISSVSDPNMRTVAPGGLMTIFGSNLAKTDSNIGGSFSGEKLPFTFNGSRSASEANRQRFRYFSRRLSWLKFLWMRRWEINR